VRHRWIWHTSIALAFASLSAPPASGETAASPDSGAPTWYALALTRGDAGLNVTQFWSKGAKLRAETVVSGHKIVTLVNGDWYYAYDALVRNGLAIRREAAAVALDASDRRPFGDEYRILLGQGAEQVGEESLLGQRAGVFRITDDRGRRDLWVTLDENHLPLRTEIFERATGQRRYTDYLSWRSGLQIPDAFFEPEAELKLERMSFEAYLARSAEGGPVGPAPVLYANRLYVKRDE
jgi:hypothetical protein